MPINRHWLANPPAAVIDQAILKGWCWVTRVGTALQQPQPQALQRLLADGDSGFLGRLNADKYMTMTSVSKATATRDLSQMVANGQLRSHGAGKTTRYYVNVTEGTHSLSVSS